MKTTHRRRERIIEPLMGITVILGRLYAGVACLAMGALLVWIYCHAYVARH